MPKKEQLPAERKMPHQSRSVPSHCNQYWHQRKPNLCRIDRNFIQDEIPQPHLIIPQQAQETRHRTEQAHLVIKRN